MKNRTRKVKEKGITLIALVVTIVILLILAGISVSVIFYDGGIITKAQETKFKTEVMQYKEMLEIEQIGQFLYKTEGDILELKEVLEKQMESLQNGKKNAQKGIEVLNIMEEQLGNITAILERIRFLIVQLKEDTTFREDDIEKVKLEIALLIIELNKISDITEYENKFLFDTNDPYVIKLDDGYFNQGRLSLKIESLKWDEIYGSETIDYNNLEEVIRKIENAIDKVVIERAKLGAKQDIVEEMEQYTEGLEKNIKSIYTQIFGDGSNITEEEAIKNAESWNTTIGIIEIAKSTYNEIMQMLVRMQALAITVQSLEMQFSDRQAIQIELEQTITEIERQITYTGISNKKLFDGTFPYIETTSLKSLQLTGLSIYTDLEIAETIQKIENAMQIIANKIAELTNKQEELETKQTEKADENCAFDIREITSQIEIPEKYTEKLQIKNGEIIYIGTDEKERQWSIELGIQIITP